MSGMIHYEFSMDPFLQHLKNCTAVWVVSSIHRAIDDKTAKDLLGENFRRQLLMDGQYGNIAFICTKTDVIKNSEIIRSLPFVLKYLNTGISLKQAIFIYLYIFFKFDFHKMDMKTFF